MKKLLFTISLLCIAEVEAQTLLSDHVNLTPLESTALPVSLFKDSLDYCNFSIQPNRFGVNELDLISTKTSLRIKDDIILLFDLNGNNSEIYQELRSAFNFLYKYDEFLFLSFKPSINYLYVKDIASNFTFDLDLAVCYDFQNHGSFAFQFSDIFEINHMVDQSQARQLIISYGNTLTSDISFELSSLIELDRSSTIIASLKYNLFDKINTRISFSSLPRSIDLHLNIDLDLINSVAGIRFDPRLGFDQKYMGEISF